MTDSALSRLEGERGRRIAVGYLCALLLVSFGLRVWWASGWPNPSRVWDERYSFENVRSVLTTGSLTPARNFYPSPLYFLPPALAIRAAEPFVADPERRLFDPETGHFGPVAYHLGRGIQVLYGTGSILLLYLLAVFLFDRAVALLAATTFAFVPWLVQVSGTFKPDAQVVFFILAVMLAGSRWMRSPSATGALTVGGAVALATSSKLIAGVAGAAFGFGALVRARERRHLAQIVLAGVSSVALFLLLNPHLDIVLSGIEDIEWDYARRADWAGMTKAQIPLRTVAYVLAPTVLGPVFGVLAWIGYCGFWITGLRSVRSRPADVAGPRLMIAAFPLAYVGTHVTQSAWFRDNNFTHVLPPFVLGFAWVVAILVRAVVRRFRIPGPGLAAVALTLGAAVVSPGVLYVYRSYVPTTLDAAYRSLIAERPERMHGRVAISEPVEARGVPWLRARALTEKGLAILRVPAAAALAPERLRRSDAEILRGDIRVRVPEAKSLEVFRPRLGRLRGPPVTVLKHFWARHSVHELRPTEGASAGAWRIELPEIEGPRFRSVAIWIQRSPSLTPDDSPGVRLPDRTIPLYRSDLRYTEFQLVSERFPAWRESPQEIQLTGLPSIAGPKLRVFLYVWAPPNIPHEFATWPDWWRELALLRSASDAAAENEPKPAAH